MINELIFKTGVIESLLRIHKTALWHEMKLDKVKELKKIQPRNRKEEIEKLKSIKQTELYYDTKISRAEKYNSEILEIIKNNTELATFTDEMTDVFNDFIKLLISAEKGKKYEVKLIEK